MKINAICVVKNEGDIIRETLLNAMKFCHRIYVFDNGSTDGTWEYVQIMAKHHEQIEIAFHSDEVFKNQLRNRVYNKYHQQYSNHDWWYILDGDEMLTETPAPMLKAALVSNKNALYSWFAQFYFTDKDMAQYEQEDQSLPVCERRRYYRVNWREVRFFRNDPSRPWHETLTGRIPPFATRFYHDAPICRHYAERTPDQIKARVKLREHNPFSFFHVRSKKPGFSWVRPAENLFYYNNDGKFEFPLSDKLDYYWREVKFWINWRWKNLLSLPTKVARMITE